VTVSSALPDAARGVWRMACRPRSHPVPV